MQAMLLNFGDATRVVCDMNNNPLVINVGQVVDADVHDAHFYMIKRGIKTDTLMIVPNECSISDKLRGCIDVIKILDDEPYSTLLQRFNEVVPYDEENTRRPTRNKMRTVLCDLARYEVAKALHMQPDVTIHEQGDETTRQPVTEPDDGEKAGDGEGEKPPLVQTQKAGKNKRR